MQGNVQYWAVDVEARSFRLINEDDELMPGEELVTGDMPVFPPDYVAEAEAQRAQLLSEANEVTADWRTELALGMLEEEDEEKLKAWMLYIKAVKAVDSASAPDIVWPEQPTA